MRGDALAQCHGVIDLLLHQLIALELDLAPADVQRGKDLVVGRGRRMRHVRLVERFLDLLLEVLVVDVNHRSLAERGQRLVGRMRHIDTDARAIRIGHEPRREQALVVRLSELLLERLVALAVLGITEALA